MRRVMALRPDALTACHRFFVKEIARWQKASSALTGAETGSVTFVQRFHSALGSFVHFHVICPDGVFTRDAEGAVSFHVGRAPTREEIAKSTAWANVGFSRVQDFSVNFRPPGSTSGLCSAFSPRSRRHRQRRGHLPRSRRRLV